MTSEADSTAGSGGSRASTIAVLATVGGIALVAVAAVVGWTRVSAGPQTDGEAALEETVPTSLVGGLPPAEVPAAVAGVFDMPVIGAANLDDLPDRVVEECSRSFGEVNWDEGQPSIEYAIATPDAISTSLVGSGENFDMGMGGGPDAPDKFRLTCTARIEGGGWVADGSGFEPIFDDMDEGHGGMGVGGYSCCDDNGLATATGAVKVPEGATWGLQDRNGWYLAYPVGKQRTLTVMWKFREDRFGAGVPPQTSITFVDNDGEVIEETFTGGQF